MKKKLIITALVIIALIVVVARQYPKLYIASGYGAKSLASGIFVAGREPMMVKDQDLNYSIVKYTSSKIDFENKSVTTSFWGLAPQTAVFRSGLGCCLIDDRPLDSVKSISFVRPSVQQVGVWQRPWPEGDKIKDTIFSEINKVKLDSAINSAFNSTSEDQKRTAAVVVIYKGQLIKEKYWEDQKINADTRLWGWSMNKSIINALVGILVKQGKLGIMASAPVSEWLNDKRRDITINDLLHMSSGLKWNENYGIVSNTTQMLFSDPDCYKAAILAPFNKKPDTEWKYSSGTANILSGIIRSTIHNDNDYHAFPYRELFNKTGMSSMIMETDASGNFVGSSFGYAIARDWARFGLLYYNNGVWQGDTILPKGWVDYTRTPAKASKGKYGAMFWLNQANQLPDVPEDTYSCQGHRGQRVFIIPSRNLVVVRLGFSDENFNHNAFLKGILASIDFKGRK
jgi:CubicO group peptidase (beta-lactamase class C family)